MRQIKAEFIFIHWSHYSVHFAGDRIHLFIVKSICGHLLLLLCHISAHTKQSPFDRKKRQWIYSNKMIYYLFIHSYISQNLPNCSISNSTSYPKILFRPLKIKSFPVQRFESQSYTKSRPSKTLNVVQKYERCTVSWWITKQKFYLLIRNDAIGGNQKRLNPIIVDMFTSKIQVQWAALHELQEKQIKNSQVSNYHLHQKRGN